jgi:hypothetical protein
MGLAALLLFVPAVAAQRRNLYTPSTSSFSQAQLAYNTRTANTNRRFNAIPFSQGNPWVGHSGNFYGNRGYVNPGFGYGFGYPGFGYGFGFPGYGSYGDTLQGIASVTAATGQYYQDIQQARITREQSRQMALDTQRKQIEFEMWYETVRPTAPKMLKQEQATDLDWARNHAQNTEIWSGRTLNVLLRSILKSPNPLQGPNIPLDERILRGLNLTDGTTRANLSLTKDEGKIIWPEALAAESFDEVRDRFTKNFEEATRMVQSSGPPPRALMNSLRKDLKTLDEKLDDQVRDLAPSRYIESRRLLNQLTTNIRGLSDPRVVKALHSDWRKNVRNVSDLVGYLMKNGLEFGPAVAGDESSYTAAYWAIRNYERAVVQYGLSTAPPPPPPPQP